ncbi:MAG: hypothetical protein KGJ93_03975 [Patescibacteria group bacterium]|nr:hypothetical protein [Patescibacteria group bacterium]
MPESNITIESGELPDAASQTLRKIDNIQLPIDRGVNPEDLTNAPAKEMLTNMVEDETPEERDQRRTGKRLNN